MDMMTRRRAMMGNSKNDIDNYVKNGIVFWLDGIENTKNGHDATSALWYDLSASQRNVSYNKDSIIGADFCIPNGKMSVTKDTSISSSYTIEVVCDYIDNGAAQLIMPWKANAYGTVWMSYTNNGAIYFSAGSSSGAKGVSVEQGIHTYAARGKSSICIDGVAGTIVSSNTTLGTAYNYMFYYNTSYPRPCVSKIYAIRIYDRLLSDAEVTHNAAIDALRFGRAA